MTFLSVALSVAALLAAPSATPRTDRLVALAHLDAAVRYFHPATATNAAAWDSAFAANVIGIADAPNGAEYARRIASLMATLGDEPPPASTSQRTLTYNGFPNPAASGSGGYALQWTSVTGPVIHRVDMGEGAHADVRLSVDASGPATVRVSAVPASAAWRARYPSAGYRVLGAMRVWSTTRLFNPYKPLIGENWNEQFIIALNAAERAQDGPEYAKAIAAFAAKIHDTHVSVGGGDARFVLPNAPVGVHARLIENQLIVTRIPDPAAERAGLRVGDVVVSVDGESVSARIARLTPLYSAATPQAMRYRLQSVLMNGSDTVPAQLVVRGASGGDRTVRVPRSYGFYQFGLAKHRTGSLIRLLPGNIGYIDLERLPQSMVDSAFRVLANTKAIILDDRGYPLGTAWAIAPRLNVNPGPTGAAKFTRWVVSSPDTATTTLYEFTQPLPPAAGVAKYAGQTVMLIDERTISQAEHTGLFFEVANGTKFIGSPTMGSNGDVTNFMIPGGISISFSGHDVRHADGRQLQRVGLRPTLAVQPTIAGIRAGRDEVLEAAHRYLGGNGEIPRDTVNVEYIPAPPPTPVRRDPLPSGWTPLGATTFGVALDRAVKRSGEASGRVSASAAAATEFGSLSQMIRADSYRGKRVRFSAYLKTRDAAGNGAVLWMRVDGGGRTIAIDNMANRSIRGTTDWTEISVVLDVPAEAEGLAFGLLLSGAGDAWIDDASFDTVGSDVAATGRPGAAPADSSRVAAMRSAYASRPASPLNLKIEP